MYESSINFCTLSWFYSRNLLAACVDNHSSKLFFILHSLLCFILLFLIFFFNFQHLVWILGLKPSTGGSLKAGRSTTDTNAVITTAVMADLPVLSTMLSRLFESSKTLDDVALHHLIDALCKLSQEAMELAYCNRVKNFFLLRWIK